MNLLERLYEKRAGGHKVISIDYIIHALRYDAQYAPCTDVSEAITINAPSVVDERLKPTSRLFQEHSVNGQPRQMSEYFIDPETQSILSQTKSRREQRRLS